MSPETDAEWLAYFRSSGYPLASKIAVGMEGTVYCLRDEELVAKVWCRRSEKDLGLLKEFYDRLKQRLDDIATPEILDVFLVSGTLVSLERFLPGMPLQKRLAVCATHADQTAVRATAEVLLCLRRICPEGALRKLQILDEATSPWQSARKWSEAIQPIVARRMKRFGRQLAGEVAELDDIVAGVNAFLQTRDDTQMGLLHGDLCGANILVDNSARPTAVIDFGFLSTMGDPAFDASISSAIFDMYGPSARSLDDQVTGMFECMLGYSRDVLLAYRALYCLLTSNAYSSEGNDGHFKWCVAMLKRGDVRRALEA